MGAQTYLTVLLASMLAVISLLTRSSALMVKLMGQKVGGLSLS